MGSLVTFDTDANLSGVQTDKQLPAFGLSLHIEGVDMQHVGDRKMPEDSAALRVSVEVRHFLEWRWLSHRASQVLGELLGCVWTWQTSVLPMAVHAGPPALRLGFTRLPCGFAAAHVDRVVPTGTHLPACPSSASLCRRSAHLPVPPGHSAPHLRSWMAVHACGRYASPDVLLCSPTGKQTRPSHPQNM